MGFPYRLGKLPATRPYGVEDFDAYLTTRPPTPPSHVDPPSVTNAWGGGWGMAGNDTYGDCVEADSNHAILALNTVLGTRDLVPSAGETVLQYQEETGGPDVGLNISTHLARWRALGLFGDMDGIPNKLPAYAPVKLGITEIQRAVWLCRAVPMGWQLPQSAQDQFPGHPFAVVPGSPIIGGHDMLAVGYDPEYLYLVTWADTHRATWPFVARYCDEAFALITQSVKEKGFGPTGVDFKSLLADLPTI